MHFIFHIKVDSPGLPDLDFVDKKNNGQVTKPTYYPYNNNVSVTTFDTNVNDSMFWSKFSINLSNSKSLSGNGN